MMVEVVVVVTVVVVVVVVAVVVVVVVVVDLVVVAVVGFGVVDGQPSNLGVVLNGIGKVVGVLIIKHDINYTLEFKYTV